MPEETTAAEALQIFRRVFVPIGDAGRVMHFSQQHARRLVLTLAIEDEDLFLVDGRWYVTRSFCEEFQNVRILTTNGNGNGKA